MRRKILSGLSAVLLIALLAGCSRIPTKEPLSGSDMFFDTVISIQIYDSGDKSLLDQCFKMCRSFEDKFSRTIETSEVSKINNAGGIPVEVSDETIELIEKGLSYSELSGGAFDITIAPVSELWDFKNNSGTVPSKKKVNKALEHVGYQKVHINDHTVTLSDPDAAIDLGGIAKGYIADRLKEYLVSEGIEHALINLGGNVLTVGTKPSGSSFNIGIQKPFDEQNKPITTVSVKDQSVVSSGVYERYFKKDDKLYHHILDPKTGYPYDNHLLSVTILSDSSADGDGLSTTCFALGLEKGMELIQSMKGVDAIFITDDYKIHDSRSL